MDSSPIVSGSYHTVSNGLAHKKKDYKKKRLQKKDYYKKKRLQKNTLQ
jgi:hypothetical protein